MFKEKLYPSAISHRQSSGASLWRENCGRGSLVLKVTDSWPVCQEFEPSTAEHPPCREGMQVKSIEAQTSSRCCSVEVSRGSVPAKVSFSSLDDDSKLQDPLPEYLE
ncbi:hypothetical protein TNCV_3505431 [Trichonephila clavipes]|uniref:Uncharacterized protein n=1 Tax=Trichonephila clavipes TaxID=2585209 RepID=A0A8X6VCA9_TRICX|nr:hypothetical protein TNCV_3505431 [Trichonephila clavipes]